MHNHLSRILLILPFLFGCGGGIGSQCKTVSDCASGYCYIPQNSSTGSCKENKTQSIP